MFCRLALSLDPVQDSILLLLPRLHSPGSDTLKTRASFYSLKKRFCTFTISSEGEGSFLLTPSFAPARSGCFGERWVSSTAGPRLGEGLLESNPPLCIQHRLQDNTLPRQCAQSKPEAARAFLPTLPSQLVPPPPPHLRISLLTTQPHSQSH